jgi:hypothetical protein
MIQVHAAEGYFLFADVTTALVSGVNYFPADVLYKTLLNSDLPAGIVIKLTVCVFVRMLCSPLLGGSPAPLVEIFSVFRPLTLSIFLAFLCPGFTMGLLVPSFVLSGPVSVDLLR